VRQKRTQSAAMNDLVWPFEQVMLLTACHQNCAALPRIIDSVEMLETNPQQDTLEGGIAQKPVFGAVIVGLVDGLWRK